MQTITDIEALFLRYPFPPSIHYEYSGGPEENMDAALVRVTGDSGETGLGIGVMGRIDTALHDLVGKLLGVPVYELPGGPGEVAHPPHPAAAPARDPPRIPAASGGRSESGRSRPDRARWPPLPPLRVGQGAPADAETSSLAASDLPAPIALRFPRAPVALDPLPDTPGISACCDRRHSRLLLHTMSWTVSLGMRSK